MRVAYLGPPGTFSDDALRDAVGDRLADLEAAPEPTVLATIEAVAGGRADLALVPLENSTDGSVRATLDALAFDGPEVSIVGEYDAPITMSLIAARELELGEITKVISHPQPLAQSARFIRTELPAASSRAAASTAEAVREVSVSAEPWAALGTRSAAEIYGCVVLREGVEDSPDNVTRFIWVAPRGVVPEGEGQWKTSLCFSELGADHPGALVEALTEFSSRSVNLNRIESRPLRRELGRYMFFVDLDGAAGDEDVAGAIGALRGKAENVHVLGSYPLGGIGLPTARPGG
jgi:prephenate dehydratase